MWEKPGRHCTESVETYQGLDLIASDPGCFISLFTEIAHLVGELRDRLYSDM